MNPVIEINYAPIDFNNVKSFLMSSQEDIKICATLQALRWRITKTKRKVFTKQMILTYMHFDLLGCSQNSSPKVLDKLL